MFGGGWELRQQDPFRLTGCRHYPISIASVDIPFKISPISGFRRFNGSVFNLTGHAFKCIEILACLVLVYSSAIIGTVKTVSWIVCLLLFICICDCYYMYNVVIGVCFKHTLLVSSVALCNDNALYRATAY